MEALNTIAKSLNHLPVDLRAEVVLADLLEYGVSIDDLIINPKGLFKRTFGRDIDRVEWVEAQHKVQRWLQINLNRSGLYDLLPEGVFHQPTSNNTSSSKESTLREMAVQQAREEQARRFFLPFEQEFFRQRLRIEQHQRTFLFGDDSQLSDDLLAWFWELPDFLTPTQGMRLVALLPVVFQIAGSLSLMEACFNHLIDEQVCLQSEASNAEWLVADIPALGQWQLGAGSVFDGWVNDGESVLRIIVTIDQTDRLPAYLPGGAGRRLIEWLAGYVVPLDTMIRLELDTSALTEAFTLIDDDAFGRLDFTTCI